MGNAVTLVTVCGMSSKNEAAEAWQGTRDVAESRGCPAGSLTLADVGGLV